VHVTQVAGQIGNQKIDEVQIWCALAMMHHIQTRGVIYQSDQNGGLTATTVHFYG
jgi:hypothetical protein